MSTWETVAWTVARAGGLTAYVLLTLAVALGLALSLRWQSPRWPRLITNDLHRFLTLLSLAFIAIHGLAGWLAHQDGTGQAVGAWPAPVEDA